MDTYQIQKLIFSAMDEYTKNGKSKLFFEIQNVILHSGDPKACEDFAAQVYAYGADIKALEKQVLKSKNASACYHFALEVPNADIKAFENVLLEIKEPYWCYCFARDIENADIKSHESVVLESKKPDLCCDFAKDVDGANMKALEEAVLEAKDPHWCYIFARNIKGASIEKHKNVIKLSILKSKEKKEMFTNLTKTDRQM